MKNQIEEEFSELVEIIRKENPESEDIQRLVSSLEEDKIPEKYKRCFRFFESLNGISKELLWRITFNPGCKKKYIKSKTSRRNKTRYR